MIYADAFVQEWNGKGIDVDGFPPEQVFQCYDAFIQYNREVIGCQPTIICSWSGYVKDFWEHFNETILPQYYTQVGPLEKGQKGDVCIWGNAPATPYSHIAILLQDNGNTQHVFGQNQPNPYCTIIDFTSNGLLGYLRPKGVEMLATANDLKYLYLGVYGYTPADDVLAQDGFIGTDLGLATMQVLDYANKNGVAYWQYKPQAEAKIADLAKQIADLQAELAKKPVATPTPPVNEQEVVPVPVPTPTTTPAPVKIKYTRYANPIIVEALKDKTGLWDFSGATWGDIAAKQIDSYAKGVQLVVVGDAQHPLGGVYLMSDFSFGDADVSGKAHNTWGINASDVKEVEVLPTPTPVSDTEPIKPVDPSPISGTPTGGGIPELLQKIFGGIIKAIVNFINKIRS